MREVDIHWEINTFSNSKIRVMAKRRKTQTQTQTPTPSSEKRPDKESSSDKESSREEEASDRKLITIFFIIIPIVSFIAYRIKFAPIPPPQTLLESDLHYQQILAENTKISKNESHRHYSYNVLAYITPWNSKGYDLVKQFASKFTHLSPVWYDLKSQGAAGLVLEGRHNADTGWIAELRKGGNAKLLPRVVLETFPKEMLGKKKLRDKAIDLIVSECKEMGYDGIVLESWSRWAAYGILYDPDMREKALQFVKQLGRTLHTISLGGDNQKSLQLVYVIGPPRSEKLQPHDFGPEDLQSLSDVVDGFSLMTYDFSSPHNPGPNAPLNWIRFTLQMLLGATGNNAQGLANKIFLGINFYGNDFVLSEGSGGGAILGRDFLSLLEKHKPILKWEKKSGEHFFLYVEDDDTKHAVFYPTLASISMRLEEARQWGVGISIWEIGQGLDYFFDLL